MIRYYKLFDYLNRNGMKKTDLLDVISSPTLAKISKGKNIQTDAIDKICLKLKCQPGDIMEVIEEETHHKETGTLFYKVNGNETKETIDGETFDIPTEETKDRIVDEEKYYKFIEDLKKGV